MFGALAFSSAEFALFDDGSVYFPEQDKAQGRTGRYRTFRLTDEERQRFLRQLPLDEFRKLPERIDVDFKLLDMATSVLTEWSAAGPHRVAFPSAYLFTKDLKLASPELERRAQIERDHPEVLTFSAIIEAIRQLKRSHADAPIWSAPGFELTLRFEWYPSRVDAQPYPDDWPKPKVEPRCETTKVQLPFSEWDRAGALVRSAHEQRKDIAVNGCKYTPDRRLLLPRENEWLRTVSGGT
jgi:hypothetical protein